jgi:DNA-binding NarL/FixJ family response regulator
MAQREHETTSTERERRMEIVGGWRSKLTEREWVIANALSRGMSYNEIAEEFHISFHTVASHVKSILRKTQQRSSRRVAAMIRLVHDDEDAQRAC